MYFIDLLRITVRAIHALTLLILALCERFSYMSLFIVYS